MKNEQTPNVKRETIPPLKGAQGDGPQKVKVTLSVHQVVNYTQQVELYPWEIVWLKEQVQNEKTLKIRDQIIEKRIDHNDIYDRGEYLDIEILEEK